MASPEGDRVVAWSLQLAEAHQVLRRQIAELRAGLGRREAGVLATHCLAFCDALTSHHQEEDDGIFPRLLARRPDLAATVAKLVEDHGMIAAILARVRELADEAAASSRGAEPAEVRRELDGLAAIMESHFGYEERVIGRALAPGAAGSSRIRRG